MFKFKIGQEVKHTGCKRNMIIKSRMEYEDFCSIENYYDCFVMAAEGCPVVDQVPEFWLEAEHRIE